MQINNSMSPNFNALKISPKAAQNLRKCDVVTLKKIEQAGRDLANTKFIDVTISENLWCRALADRRAFTNSNQHIAMGDYTITRQNFLGNPFDYLLVNQGNNLLRDIKEIDKIANIAVELDKEAVKYSNKKNIDIGQNVDDAVTKLLDTYGE